MQNITTYNHLANKVKTLEVYYTPTYYLHHKLVKINQLYFMSNDLNKSHAIQSIINLECQLLFGI